MPQLGPIRHGAVVSALDADGRTAPWLVLIGPAAAGKSTLGGQLAAATGKRFADLDDVAGPYYSELGWTMARLRQRIDEAGLLTAEREWEPARAHAVERAVAGHPGMILALGAGPPAGTAAQRLNPRELVVCG